MSDTDSEQAKVAMEQIAADIDDLAEGLSDEEEPIERGEHPPHHSAFADLQQRCSVAGIECEHVENAYGETLLRLAIPAGRGTRTLIIRDYDDAQNLLAVPFEKYRYLEDYEGAYSIEDGCIEAGVRPVGSGAGPMMFQYRRLFGVPENPDRSGWPAPITLSKGDGSGVEIELGAESEIGKTLVGHPRRFGIALTVRGVQIKGHEDARDLLEEYSNSLFFQIDAKLRVPLQLRRERRREVSRRRPIGPVGKASDLSFPQTAFDREPMSLFWYARGAAGMPLLQFLAYYQVIEFYFPIYAQDEVRRRLRNVVKDPAFNPHSDREIGRLVDVLSSAGGRGVWGDERTQLLATLRACVDGGAIRELIAFDQYEQHFERKVKRLAETTLRASTPDDQLVARAAERIYEIRCKIVHTKEGGPASQGLLLPFSREADKLWPDIELVELASRRVLAAAGRPIVA